MTRQQIRDRILDSLNQSITAPKTFALAHIDEIILEAFEVLSEEARALKRQAVLALQSGRTYYYTEAIAPDVMVITRLTLAPDDWRLIPVTFRQLNDRHERWQRITATTPQVWVPISWNLFGLFPHVVTGNKLLRADYIAWPRAFIDDDDSLEYQDADQEGAVLYGVYRGLLQTWDFDNAMTVFASFIERFADVKFKSDVGRAMARERMPSRPSVPPLISPEGTRSNTITL